MSTARGQFRYRLTLCGFSFLGKLVEATSNPLAEWACRRGAIWRERALRGRDLSEYLSQLLDHSSHFLWQLSWGIRSAVN
jgi:hypothetical protein